jgi:hypothetical protein
MKGSPVAASEMTQSKRKLLAVVLASLLVCSAFAPGVLAATATAANTQVGVDTGPATDVSVDSATLNGSVTELNGSNATVSFEYWVQGDQSNSTTVAVGELSEPGTFDAEVTDLDANTTYVYVATAETDSSAATGGQETFTTPETLSVSVETGAATNVTENGATLAGNLTDVSGTENASVNVRYWEVDDRSTTTVVQAGETSEGTFSVNVSDLDANTTYTYVASAEAERGDETAEDSGNESNFTTSEAGEPLDVETDDASDVTNESATLNGELDGLGGADNATVSFEYWAEGDRDDSTNTTDVELDSPGTFSASVSGLQNNTTYVYVAQADNGTTSVAGEQVEFTTQSDEPPLGVETDDASDVTNESATLNGELTGLGGADDATVSFEYWVQDDRANSTNTTDVELDSPGTFSADISGLQNDTTYVYVAQAEADGSSVTGEQVTFETGANETEDEFESPDGPFGQQVVAFIDFLRNSDDSEERNMGRAIASWVVANNPGNAPDHAGPPEDRGPDKDDERERGPPDDRGPDRDDTDDEDEEETEDEEESEGGEDDDGEEDDEEETEDDDDDDSDSAPGNSGNAPGR